MGKTAINVLTAMRLLGYSLCLALDAITFLTLKGEKEIKIKFNNLINSLRSLFVGYIIY